MANKKILIVDDDQGILNLFTSALEDEVDSIFTAQDGEDGYKIFEKENPDLIILDIMLPDINGVELLKKIKAHNNEAIVIMVTAYASLDTSVQAVKEGAYDYIIKPVNVDEVIVTVNRALEKRKLLMDKEGLVEELKDHKKQLEQKVIVTEKRLSETSTELETVYGELKETYESILHEPESLFKKIKNFYSTYTTWFIIPALLAGILGAKYSSFVSKISDAVMGNVIDVIIMLAPVAIFLVLAPAVAKMLKTRKESKFAGFVVIWFSITRVLAAIWAAIFVGIALGLPLVGHGSENLTEMFIKNMKLLGTMMYTSVFFQAMWVSIIIGIISYKWNRLYKILEKGSNAVERFGDHLEPWIPIVAFLIGSFIYGLPKALAEQVSPEVLASIGDVHIFGMGFSLKDEFGLISVYFVEALLIGVGCFIWQLGWIFITKKFVPDFSIKYFFKQYWLKVYPLAWSTASEAVSMPLNMSLIRRKYKSVHAMVRKLVVGLGAYLNVNGTTMDIMVLTAVVSTVVGHQASILALMMSVPIIVLVGYGVPGIPGEAVLFAIPMMTIIGLPPELVDTFMAIFVAIQLGLPDSFRTGANVTDNGLFAVLLNKKYEKSLKK